MTIDEKTVNKEKNDMDKSNKINSNKNLIANETLRNSFIKNNEKLKIKKDDTENDPSKGLSIFQKVKLMISLITVEPILVGFVVPSVLSNLATQNLYLDKACRVNLGFEQHICDALTKRDTANYTFEEEAVQTLVASVAGWKTVLQSFLPCGTLIFVGAYSDRIGQRKFCMLLPIIGEFLTSIGLIVNTYFFYQLPVEVAAVTEAIFPALTGGWPTMFMGIFSYIADVTTEEQRTVRIGITNLFYFLGMPLGAALSGILLRKISLYGVFSLCATIYVLSFFYGYYRIKEVKRSDIQLKKTSNCCEWLRDFFDMRYVKDTLMVAFKRGPNKRRLRVIMLVVVLCVVVGPINGELSVIYLFTRYRFNWDELDFSMFTTYIMCTSLVGTLIAVGVFSHLLKLDDAIIGVISCMSKILSSFMYAFSTKTWQIYIAPLIEMFNGTSIMAMRSMVSKLVEKNELGKLNSLFGVAEAMMPLVFAPMYTTVYSATIGTFPGAFFFLGGGLTVPALLIFLWLYLANKKYKEANFQQNLREAQVAEDKPETISIDNKAFENEDKSKIPNNTDPSNQLEDTEKFEKTVSQSQIEMGFTESMICTSKL